MSAFEIAVYVFAAIGLLMVGGGLVIFGTCVWCFRIAKPLAPHVTPPESALDGPKYRTCIDCCNWRNSVEARYAILRLEDLEDGNYVCPKCNRKWSKNTTITKKEE